MKPRNQLTAAEVEGLIIALEARLDTVGLPTQPEVAKQVIKLVSDPNSVVGAYARVIKTDASLAGRLLRLANSAHFAQRVPVTSLDRACILLGVERLKAVTLGFYLSRGAATDRDAKLSRHVWTQSVFRACLAASLARSIMPRVSSEAFIVGLLIDSGLPLMPKLATRYEQHADPFAAPAKLAAAESAHLAFTHVDVASALCRRWKLPAMLAKPIQWHHLPPRSREGEVAVNVLHRLAYFVGALELEPDSAMPATPAPMANLATRVLGLNQDSLALSVRSACDEYRATAQMFQDIADPLTDLDALASIVHHRLVGVVEETVVPSMGFADVDENTRFLLGGFLVEIARDDQGGVASVCDAKGECLMSYRFNVGDATPESIRDGLGLDAQTDDEVVAMKARLQRLAA
ncbi:MAG: HDOD domain-containing protein [Planctomycetota bacterium]|nr:HDOD domain-containing protein [Planctomycetota bacterium]